jgi:hypothetical protein
MNSGNQDFQRGCFGCSFWIGALIVIGILWRAPKQYLWESIALTVVCTALIMIAAASMNDWAIGLSVFALLFLLVVGRYVVTGNQRYLNETFQAKGKKTAQTTPTPQATLPPGVEVTEVPAVALELSPSALAPTVLPPTPTLTPAPAVAAAAIPPWLQTNAPTSLFAPLLAAMSEAEQAHVVPGPKWVNDTIEWFHKSGMGKITLNRDDAKPETGTLKDWRLVLGVILAAQFLFSLYYSERVGQGDTAWILTILSAFLLFTKLSEWMYEVIKWVFDLGVAGKVISVLLSLVFGLTGVGSIGAFFIGAFFYNDVRVLSLCVLPSAIVALPIIYMKWKKSQNIL